MAAVPSIGRANRVEGAAPPEAELTHALYEQYAGQIFRYCLHQLGSREEAEDAVQSTFLNAFRGIKRGIVPELESAWLFKIAHNVCLSRRRSTWRRGRIESPTDFEVVEELAAAPSRRADELIGLQDVLEAMPEQQRRAILLREWQGLSYREIADELELSQAAVETLIFRARRSLANGLEQPERAPRGRKRLSAGVLGNLVSSAQSFLFGGGAAVKVAATVAVVSAGTVVATAPVRHHHAPVRPARAHPRPVRATHATTPTPPVTSGRPAAPAVVHSSSRPTSAPQVRPRKAAHRAPAPSAPIVPAVPDVQAPTAPTIDPQAAPEPAPAATSPTLPPGQEKKQEGEATPQRSHGRATAPGQLKKSDGSTKRGGGGSKKGDPPVATAPENTAPGDTSPDSGSQGTPAPQPTDSTRGSGKDTAPGQESKADPPSTPSSGDNGSGNGPDN